MAYDERFAQRVRDVIEVDAIVSERAMFGGLAFMFDGNMALAVTGNGELMVRVDRAQVSQLTSIDDVSTVTMGEREMKGWVLITGDELRTRAKLRKWVNTGTTYALTLPAK